MPEAGHDAADDGGAVIDPSTGSGELLMPPASLAPIRINIGAGSVATVASDEPLEHITRVCDADLLADCWDADAGEFVEPPSPWPSAREQALRDCRAILGMPPRRQVDRVRQVPVLLDPQPACAGQDAQQLDTDVVPELMTNTA